uniref:Uncharacterized protein n=1 Tax=Candidozyma auris TaxID=498019 RepID=A0A0L0NZ36_CANAR
MRQKSQAIAGTIRLPSEGSFPHSGQGAVACFFFAPKLIRDCKQNTQQKMRKRCAPDMKGKASAEKERCPAESACRDPGAVADGRKKSQKKASTSVQWAEKKRVSRQRG